MGTALDTQHSPLLVAIDPKEIHSYILFGSCWLPIYSFPPKDCNGLLALPSKWAGCLLLHIVLARRQYVHDATCLWNAAAHDLACNVTRFSVFERLLP